MKSLDAVCPCPPLSSTQPLPSPALRPLPHRVEQPTSKRERQPSPAFATTASDGMQRAQDQTTAGTGSRGAHFVCLLVAHDEVLGHLEKRADIRGAQLLLHQRQRVLVLLDGTSDQHAAHLARQPVSTSLPQSTPFSGHLRSSGTTRARQGPFARHKTNLLGSNTASTVVCVKETGEQLSSVSLSSFRALLCVFAKCAKNKSSSMETL